ncbi:MAG: hypothetical protein JXB05_31650 [Myxococcaceae bacterium]|nr:hypothetical protein [Myxococcaceae bacterium]
MRRLLCWLLVFCLMPIGCASENSAIRGREGPVEAPGVFLPAELLEWEEGSAEAWEEVGWDVFFVEAEPAAGVELAMARRPPRRGGRGGLPGRLSAPLLNPRPSREEIAARRRRTENDRAVKLARERYYEALAEARARYPEHQGYQDHHFIPIYLGGPENGVKYRLPSFYHQAITQEFRRLRAYGQRKPSSEELQEILLKVYSKYPIPQLIGITP